MAIPYAAIRELVRYLEHDERKHFEAMRKDGEDITNHIYLAVREVADWLGEDEKDGDGGRAQGRGLG